MTIDASLYDWKDIKNKFTGCSLLIGNGASIAAWRDFNYKKLKDEANLSSSIKELFELYNNTSNFEEILSKLTVTSSVLEILPDSSKESKRMVKKNYTQLQSALFQALSKVHPSKQLWSQENELKTRKYLKTCSSIYTTNYDLILPWIILMESNGNGFKDFIFNKDLTFDKHNVKASNTVVYYLHGAIHFFSNTSFDTIKIRSAASIKGGITSIKKALKEKPNSFPLIITEGSSKQKENTIKKYDYLSFCHENLRTDEEDFVIFGQSLNKELDAHIVEALRKKKNREFAISIYTNDKSRKQIHEEKEAYKRLIGNNKGNNISFFDSATHPLGAKEREITS